MKFMPRTTVLIILLVISLSYAGCSAAPAAPQTKNTETPGTASDPGPSGGNPMIQPKRTLNIAHRGARSLAPENTLASARKGFEIGADLWELDVAVTSDGELVVLHDDTLDRTSNVAEIFPDRRGNLVYSFSMAELRRLDFGSWFVKTDPFKQIAAGAVSKAEQEKFVGEPIPTLREALVFTREHDWRVNIEIKDASKVPGADAVIVEKTVALVKELGMTGQVLISSFNHSYIQKVKTLEPALVTAALVETAAADPAGLLRQTKAQAYNPSVKVINPVDIRPLRQQGFDVYIWTVNDEATMTTLVDAGVSGIFTDFPQLLKKVLEKKP
jgi:glycerophosphoryl diester phosphodiesterase